MEYKRIGYNVKRIYFDKNSEILINKINSFGFVSWHYHKKMTEIFVFNNDACLGIDKKWIRVCKGDYIIINPGEKHSIFAGHKGLDLIVIRFPVVKGDRYL